MIQFKYQNRSKKNKDKDKFIKLCEDLLNNSSIIMIGVYLKLHERIYITNINIIFL